MKKFFATIAVLFCFLQVSAHENVAVLAMDFFKALRENEITHIEKHFIELKQALPLLPREARAMTIDEKMEAYLIPQQTEFKNSFKEIQTEISAKEVNTRKIIFHSYKLDSLKGPLHEDGSIMAMSLYFTYNKKQHVIPISVVLMEGQWYALEILHAKNIFN